MHGATHRALLQRSFPTDLIAKILHNDHNITILQSMSAPKLRKHYSTDECKIIREKVVREPIDPVVLDNVLEKAESCCAYCGDGNSTRPYQIHHIDLYSKSQDNSEENLFLLCPNHHVVVHSKKTSISEQKTKRREWHAIVEIATRYRTHGIAFPFGALYDGLTPGISF